MAPMGNAKTVAMLQASSNQQVADDSPAELKHEDFSDDPELMLMVWDHNSLRALRSRYLHISHNCSLTPTFTSGMINYMDPYSRSTRDAKIREHYHG